MEKQITKTFYGILDLDQHNQNLLYGTASESPTSIAIAMLNKLKWLEDEDACEEDLSTWSLRDIEALLRPYGYAIAVIPEYVAVILNDSTQTEKFYSGPYYGVKGVSCLIEEEVVMQH